MNIKHNDIDRNEESHPSSHTEDKRVIPVIEEQVKIDKENVEIRVSIKKHTWEEEASSNVELEHDEVEVTHVPVNRTVSEQPSARQEGDTMIIPVIREEIEVKKKLVLVEEVHIKNTRRTETKPIKAKVKKEKVFVHREELDNDRK